MFWKQFCYWWISLYKMIDYICVCSGMPMGGHKVNEKALEAFWLKMVDRTHQSNCSLPKTTIFVRVVSYSLWPHGILQARILEEVAFPFSRGSSQPRDQTQVSHIAGGSLPTEPQGKPKTTIVISFLKKEKTWMHEEGDNNNKFLESKHWKLT